MKRKRRRPTKATGSLARNVVFFGASITILIGASILFHSIIQWSELPFKELFPKKDVEVAAINPPDKSTTSHPRTKGPSPQAKGKLPPNGMPAQPPDTAAIGTYEYSFYDILSHRNQSQKPADESHYGIQVGAFKSHQAAQAMSDELKRTKRLECRLAKKGNLTTVVWGNFPTKKAAERANKKISRILERPCLVIETG